MVKAKRKGPKKQVAKKKWVTILAPKMFNSYPLGETYVFDARDAIGTSITVNMMTVTRNPKAQGTNIGFIITGQHDGKLLTEFSELRIMPSNVRRMVRRGKDKIEDSFICLTSDGKKVRIKPIAITRTKSKGSVLTILRANLRKFIIATASKTTYEQLAIDIIDRKIQRDIQKILSKIYPVINCDIRWFKIVNKEILTGNVYVEEEKTEPVEKKVEETKEEKTEPVKKKVEETKEEKPQAEVKA